MNVCVCVCVCVSLLLHVEYQCRCLPMHASFLSIFSSVSLLLLPSMSNVAPPSSLNEVNVGSVLARRYNEVDLCNLTRHALDMQ